MPLPRFYDKEVFEEIAKLQGDSKENTSEDIFEEHQFILDCLDLGLTLDNLKELSYVDVLKMLVCKIRRQKELVKAPNTPQKEEVRKATQNDWDRLAGG